MTFRLEDDPEVEDEQEDQNEDSDPKGESDAGKPAKSADKRISEMQSERDRETARANKAEKQLKALLGVQGAGAEGGSPEGDTGQSAILDMARMFAEQQNPKLAEYGLTGADLTGTTPAEIAASASQLVARFEKIETRALNKVLAERGLAPEIDGQVPPPKPRDFTNMPKEDFDKVVAKALATPAQS